MSITEQNKKDIIKIFNKLDELGFTNADKARLFNLNLISIYSLDKNIKNNSNFRIQEETFKKIEKIMNLKEIPPKGSIQVKKIYALNIGDKFNNGVVVKEYKNYYLMKKEGYKECVFKTDIFKYVFKDNKNE